MYLSLSWKEFALFLRIDKKHSQKPGAVQANKSRFNAISHWFSDKEWSQRNFRTFLAELEDQGRGQETLNKYVTFDKYIDEYLGLEETKSFKTVVPRLPKIEEVLTPKEIDQLARLEYPYQRYPELMNTRQKALFMLLGLSGCRISDALELKWKNLHAVPAKHLTFEFTKNKDDRDVWLDDELWDLIHQIPKTSEYVFVSARNNKRLDSADINRDLKRRAKKLGIKKRVYCHIFRHSLATLLGEMGIPNSDIAKLMGWKDQRMLMRYKNSNLEYFASIMKLHPLLQSKLSYQERGERLVREARKLFNPDTHKINTSMREGKIVLEIEALLGGENAS